MHICRHRRGAPMWRSSDLQIATMAPLLRLGQRLVWTLVIAYLYGYASLRQAKRSS
jgi:hypothetical protein